MLHSTFFIRGFVLTHTVGGYDISLWWHCRGVKTCARRKKDARTAAAAHRRRRCHLRRRIRIVRRGLVCDAARPRQVVQGHYTVAYTCYSDTALMRQRSIQQSCIIQASFCVAPSALESAVHRFACKHSLEHTEFQKKPKKTMCRAGVPQGGLGVIHHG